MTRLASLDLRALRELAVSVEHELAQAALHGAPHKDLAKLLARVEARVATHEGDLTPTLQRRQRLYAER